MSQQAPVVQMRSLLGKCNRVEPCTVGNLGAEMATDDQLALVVARELTKTFGSFVAVDDSDLGAMTVQAPVVKMSETPGVIEHLGRDLGADNDAVYGGLLGLSAERLDALRAAGTI